MHACKNMVACTHMHWRLRMARVCVRARRRACSCLWAGEHASEYAYSLGVCAHTCAICVRVRVHAIDPLLPCCACTICCATALMLTLRARTCLNRPKIDECGEETINGRVQGAQWQASCCTCWRRRAGRWRRRSHRFKSFFLKKSERSENFRNVFLQ